MTNFGRWEFYCKDIKSPNVFIEFGYYAMIAAVLQRRVWRGSMRKPLFPNLYTFLVADPGIGKGLVLEEVEKVLKHHRMKEEDLVKDTLFGSMHKAKKPGQNGKLEMPYLVHIGPNSVTYEMMVFEMGSNVRSFFYELPEEPGMKRLYLHSSTAFVLMEMSSLFRKNVDDLVNFLLQAFDCGDYQRLTLGRGEDKITNCCLNLMAGTTPSFIKKAFSDELLDQGFASRSLMVYASANRFARAKPPEFTPEQISAHAELLVHIKNLALLFGEVQFTDEADKYLEKWTNDCATGIIKRTNTSLKLKGYYARRDTLVQKLAMCKHYSESLSNVVEKADVEWAIEGCERLEKSMHLCFVGEDKNPLFAVTTDIFNYLQNKGPTRTDVLLVLFYRDLPNGKRSLDECIEYLVATSQIQAEGNKWKVKL